MKKKSGVSMISLIIATVAVLFAPLSSAEDDTGVFNFVFENDAFANTDYHYSSGILLNYVGGRNAAPRFLLRLARKLPYVDEGDDIYTGLHLGQQIFTPDDIHSSDLLTHERPYAGYLYAGLSLTAANASELGTLKMSIGTVGPSSRGEQFQTSIHSRLGVNAPQGWANQLNDETIFQLDYQNTWRQFWRYSGDILQADVLPYSGVALGNAAVHLGTGLTLRIGPGIDSDFGPPRMRPSLPGSTFFNARRGTGWYFFVGLGGRYVAHNIFLDGNSDGSSHSVDKYDWVGDLQTGWVLNTRNYRLAYTFVGRSREYKTQGPTHMFGSMTLSFKF
jgi:lipid A 3-O-deacylase